MPTNSDRIRITDYSINLYLEQLIRKTYQIPTFQREVVWSPDSVKKLWDSIFRFYPIGSILIWKTDLKLQNHRSIGGHVIAKNDKSDEFQYILDGQQRTTALLTSLYGGEIEGRPGFDPSLYVDISIEDVEEIDDQSYKQRFLFWNEIDDRNGSVRQNTPRMDKYRKGVIISLHDIMLSFGKVERTLHDNGYADFDDPARVRLRDTRDVISNYRLSFIELTGIEVSEVCQIFERINQEGKPLDIFDIVVAKTFRVAANGDKGFYLRELIDDFRDKTDGFFDNISDSSYLDMLAAIIMRTIPNTGVSNITPLYLNRIRTEQLEAVWPGAVIAFNKLFDFFENHLHLKGPRLIPYRYFFLSLVYYFYENPNPDYELVKKYFWYYSFHFDDLLANTTHLRQHLDLLSRAKSEKQLFVGRFRIDRQSLRAASYTSQGRLSTAVLALLANQQPYDWANTDKLVLNDVYYQLQDKPNLHHIFPSNYIKTHRGANMLDENSLMNIAYLPQITNLKISDRNPMEYLRDYDLTGFDRVLNSHLIPNDVLEWSRLNELPENGLDQMIELRIDLILDSLRKKLDGIAFDVFDSSEPMQSTNPQ